MCHWSIEGLWIGLGLGILGQAILYLRIVIVSDWQEIADHAAKRIQENNDHLDKVKLLLEEND